MIAPVKNLQFLASDDTILIHTVESPVHVGVSIIGAPPRVAGGTNIYDSKQSFRGLPGQPPDWIRIGVPFYAQHSKETNCHTGAQTCVKRYLIVGISEKYKNHLYIARYQENVDLAVCDHETNLQQLQYSSNRTLAAFLAGYRPRSNSIGTILAMTKDGTRIAAANWNCIVIWTICPDMLSQGPYDAYFPPRDFNKPRDLGRIRPVLLPSQGVVYTMQWTDRDNLFAVTDRGIAKWYVGHLKAGRRDSELFVRPPSSSSSRSQH